MNLFYIVGFMIILYFSVENYRFIKILENSNKSQNIPVK